MNAALAKAPADPRRPMIAKVKIACKELAIDDATYRAILVRITGKASAAYCSYSQLAAVLDELKAKGWKPNSSSTTRKPVASDTKRADHPAARKARALWISLFRLGVVRNGSEEALEAFAARQLGVEKLQWADGGRVYKLIEALKAMAERAGWSQDTAGIEDAEGKAVVLKMRLEKLIRERGLS